MDDEEYQKEYDKAYADLDAAAPATTARSEDGKFKKAEPVEEGQIDAPDDKPAEVATEKEPTPQDLPKDEPKEDDEVTALRKRLDAAEKMAKDNQAWATKLSQERAAERKERESWEREANKPAILDANPELADAIRYVSSDKPAEQPDPHQQWIAIVDRAHPGIFSNELDKDLETALAKRLTDLSNEDRADPLIAIREITAEKLAHAERKQAAKEAAAAKASKEKAAMSVPGAGAGGGSRTPVDTQQADVQRIQNMTPADFEKERRRVLGY